MSFVPLDSLRVAQPPAAAKGDDGLAPVTVSDEADLKIGGMHCASCVSRVEQALGSVAGVSEASVNLATERAHVRLAAPVSTGQSSIVHLLRDSCCVFCHV